MMRRREEIREAIMAGAPAPRPWGHLQLQQLKMWALHNVRALGAPSPE